MKKFRIILVLDRSGSMASVVPATMQGVNELIRSTKNIASTLKVGVNLTFIGFEDNRRIEFIPDYKDVDVKDAKKVTPKEIFGRGGTNMYDAMSFMFEKTEDVVATKEQVLVAVFSDGETGGDITPAGNVASAVDKTPKWTFAFVGANQDAKNAATKMGFPATNAMEYKSDASGTRGAFYKLTRGIRKWMENNVDTKKPKTDDFFFDDDLKQSVMAVNGVKLAINMPEAIQDEDDKVNELPPYAPIAAHVVDEYPECPKNWEHGSAKASSYFVSAKEGHGMWFDFNGNADNDYDIAAVISVQGINPITGQPTNLPLRLEKYDEKCPLHNEEFHQDRFCKKCGFKWPTQNFISSSGSPKGQFWLDGFRTPEGKVRQYVFTEESAKGVAKSIIGEDRVFAIGVAFYRSKEKKPVHYFDNDSLSVRGLMPMGLLSSGPRYTKGLEAGASWSANSTGGIRGMSIGGASSSAVFGEKLASYSPQDDGPIGSSGDDFGAVEREEKTSSKIFMASIVEAPKEKDYEVSAGAKINQAIHADPNSLEYWQEAPIGVIYVNYADETAVKRILNAGKRKEVTEGFLAGVAVGNKVMKIAFDIGGVISKYPDKFRELITVLQKSGIEIHIITDMHSKDEVIQTLNSNGFEFITASNIHCADYQNLGEFCKAKLLKDLSIDLFFDDFVGYTGWDSSFGDAPIRFLLMPDPFKPYWDDSWKCNGGDFGRRKYSQT